MKKAVARTASKPPAPLRRTPLDRVFFWLVAARLGHDNIAQYPQRLSRHLNALPDGMNSAFQGLDGKSTGLLAHVSLMIAGLGLVAPLIVDNEFEKGVVIAEIAAYLLIAVGCLRCLAIFPFREFGDGSPQLRNLAFQELMLRRELYGFCNRASINLTIAVFVLLPFLYFYKPEH